MSPPLPQSTPGTAIDPVELDWSEFTLGPNDKIRIIVLGQPELSTSVSGFGGESSTRISADGTINMPMAGIIPAAGQTPNELAHTIKIALSRFFKHPEVSVAVVEYSSRRYYLFGEIANTGPFTMDRPITALEALSAGGGLLPGANRGQAVIIRRDGRGGVEVLRFNALIPGADGLVQVRADDFIFVQKSGVGTFTEQIAPYLSTLGFSISEYDTITGN
ncbi:MAG: polysaccharide export protein [bacterium]|nr:polysaccharide export protein [bacterium]